MKKLYNTHESDKWLKRFILSNPGRYSSLRIFFLSIFFTISNTFVFSQFILDGSTINSGDYTCGTSTVSLTSSPTDETDYEMTICPQAGEVLYLEFGIVDLNDNGNSAEDDYIYVYEGGNGGTLLYSDGDNGNGNDNFVVTGLTSGACLTIVFAVEDIAPVPGFTATIGCLPAANAGADQNPGDCSTSTILGGTDPSPASGSWTVTPSAGVSFSSTTDPNATVNGMTAGTEYEFVWAVTDGTATHTDTMLFNSVGPGCQIYCEDPDPYTNATVGYISNVDFNSGALANSSAHDGYANNTGLGCVSFIQGDAFSIDIDITHGTTNTMHHFFWIDWDGDGFFENDESTDLGSTTASTTFNISETVPCDGATGNIRIRIISQFSSDPVPCSSPTIYGDAEDYCIAVSAAPVPVASATSTYSACATTATLDATGSSITDGYWEIVVGTGTITDATSQSTTITDLENGLTTLQWNSTGLCETDAAQTSFTVSGLPDEPVSAGLDAFTCTDPFTLSGSSTAPFNDPTDGFWSIISEPGGSSASFSDVNSSTSDITGLINGTYTLQWNVVTDACGTVTDQVDVVFGTLPTPDAGTDQIGICPTGAVLDATPVDGVTGTWSIVSEPGGSSAGFADVNDPTTTIFGLIAGTYTLQWEFSGGGCAGTTTDQVTLDVSSCTTALTHDPINDQAVTGCSFTYTDDGGPSGNYSDNINQTWMTICPDDPSAFSTITLTAESMLTYDYIVIYDEDSPGAPVVGGIWDGTVYPSLGATITSSTGCLYIQANSNASSVSSGWAADIGCSSTAGTQTQDYVQVNNCGGGGGITVCSSGPITAESNSASNPPDLGNQNQGCLGSQEGSSNTWVYINAATDGWISFELTPPGGQDYDYAIWGPYDGGYACPMYTRDDPIRCSWAANGGAACDAVIGLGVENQDGNAVLTTDVSEEGTCVPTSNEGWTYPIYANAGEVYVLLFQNYGNNNSTFDFALNNDLSSIPSGESFASLGCDPITVLPIELSSFRVVAQETFNELEWVTSSERNNSHFTIEKSNDGFHWNHFKEVEGAGSSNEKITYNLNDYAITPGITYYRLSQTDFDGTTEILQIVSVDRRFQSIDIISDIFPNPTKDEFYFYYTGKDNKQPIEVSIYDALGKQVSYTDYKNFNEDQAVKVDTGNLTKGTYIVRVSQGNIARVKRVTIL